MGRRLTSLSQPWFIESYVTLESLCFQKSSLSLMLYLADNLAYIPYTVVDEPLYVIHQIDIMISVSGSNLLQTFKEVSLPGRCGLLDLYPIKTESMGSNPGHSNCFFRAFLSSSFFAHHYLLSLSDGNLLDII